MLDCSFYRIPFGYKRQYLFQYCIFQVLELQDQLQRQKNEKERFSNKILQPASCCMSSDISAFLITALRSVILFVLKIWNSIKTRK